MGNSPHAPNWSTHPNRHSMMVTDSDVAENYQQSLAMMNSLADLQEDIHRLSLQQQELTKMMQMQQQMQHQHQQQQQQQQSPFYLQNGYGGQAQQVVGSGGGRRQWGGPLSMEHGQMMQQQQQPVRRGQ
jgi:hypothetical protein